MWAALLVAVWCTWLQVLWCHFAHTLGCMATAAVLRELFCSVLDTQLRLPVVILQTVNIRSDNCTVHTIRSQVRPTVTPRGSSTDNNKVLLGAWLSACSGKTVSQAALNAVTPGAAGVLATGTPLQVLQAEA